MTAPPVAELEQLAQNLAAHTAPRVRWAVQRRDEVAVAELLEPLDVIQLRALVVVLATQTPRMRSRPDDGVIDEVAIARVVDGGRAELTRPEQIAAAKALQARGHTPSEISGRLRTNVNTVRKLLQEVAA